MDIIVPAGMSYEFYVELTKGGGMKLPKVFDESFIDSPKRNKNLLPHKITLTQLYMHGYFITEMFGTTATVVKKISGGQNEFSCTDRQVEFGPHKDETLKHIERLRDEMWKKYKKYF